MALYHYIYVVKDAKVVGSQLCNVLPEHFVLKSIYMIVTFFHPHTREKMNLSYDSFCPKIVNVY